ncbi:rho GTPase-activating protein 6-like [Calypte anna]|uniref:rho GTPase-activating protein 6-like n=1 Tax=Calypte anna TaxID=9244 RepID=UPI0011C45127|nr:rho GTPase-activating protein 6-like [Calypte anna]
MSAQSLLSSVFSCSSPAAAKSLSKRRLRQTRSLDPAIIGGGREDGSRAPRARAAGSPLGERRYPRGAPTPYGASFSTPSTPLERSPPGSAVFDEESPRGKRSPGWELPFLARSPSASALSGPAGPANSIFSSPRRWLQQRKGQPSPPGPRPAAYVVWKSEVGPPAPGGRAPAGPPSPPAHAVDTRRGSPWEFRSCRWPG